MMGIWYGIRSETLRNDVFGACMFCDAKSNMLVRRYEPTQLTIWKITNIARMFKIFGTETPFKALPRAHAEQGGNARVPPLSKNRDNF